MPPELRLWLRIESELAGAYGMGSYPEPRALQTVLDWHHPEIADWFGSQGYPVVSEDEMMRVARTLILSIAHGRATADEDDEDGV